MAKITEKKLKETVIWFNRLAKERGIRYGFALNRALSGYSIIQQQREPGSPPERIQWGMSASEVDAFLWGAATVVRSLPKVEAIQVEPPDVTIQQP